MAKEKTPPHPDTTTFKTVALKNTAVGPRGIQAHTGVVMLEPGASKEVEVSTANLKRAEASGYFEFGGKVEKADGDGLDSLKFDDLKAMAAERNIAVPVGTSKKALLEALRAPAA